jgi:hypothetical protein
MPEMSRDPGPLWFSVPITQATTLEPRHLKTRKNWGPYPSPMHKSCKGGRLQKQCLCSKNNPSFPTILGEKKNYTRPGAWKKGYVDLKGALNVPTGVLKATSWNGPAILPRGNHPKSPPFFPDGHSEYSAASCFQTPTVHLQATLLLSQHPSPSTKILSITLSLSKKNQFHLQNMIRYMWLGNSPILSIKNKPIPSTEHEKYCFHFSTQKEEECSLQNRDKISV